jgi:hypothetical protein
VSREAVVAKLEALFQRNCRSCGRLPGALAEVSALGKFQILEVLITL